MLGPERKSRLLSEKEKEITAYHEAGHAIVAHFLLHTDPVHKISIIARGQAGGYTIKVPEMDKHLHTRAEFIDDLAVSMGGLAAEKFKFKDMTTGASVDLLHATQLARRIITHYGMSDTIGPISYNQDSSNGNGSWPWEEIREQYSNETLATIDKEVSQMLRTAFESAATTVEKNQNKLELIAQKLLTQETIEKEEFEKMMKE
jgi:cell division protease FtsH